MKKLLSLVISAVLVLASVLTVSAAANSVEASIVVYDGTVTVKTETTGRITLKIFKDSSLVYVGQANKPKSGTTDTYEINFELKYNAPTGNYRVVTNRGETTFYYANPVDRINFYTGLDLANDTKETITSKITAAFEAGFNIHRITGCKKTQTFP